MARLGPAIHVFVLPDIKDVNARDRRSDAVLRTATRGHDDSIQPHRALVQGEAVKRSLSSADLTHRRSGRPLGGVLPIIGVILDWGSLPGRSSTPRPGLIRSLPRR